MENILYNFARISFQPREVVLSENRVSAMFSASAVSGVACAPLSRIGRISSIANEMQASPATTSDEDPDDEIDSQLSRGEDDNDDDSDCRSSYSSNGRRGGVSRRRMPARASKDTFNRVCSVIMKPNNKKKRKELNTNAQTLKSIEKIYTNKRLKKFTPTNLETIFEEPSDENAADAEDDSEECAMSSQVRLVKFGGRKMRRSISFSDGLNKNKLLLKKRRQKIKKTFGKRITFKKISISEFHDRLNKSLDSAMLEEEEEEQVNESDSQLNIVDSDNTKSSSAAVTMDDLQLPALVGALQQAAFQ